MLSRYSKLIKDNLLLAFLVCFILLDEDPEWVWKRTDESGNNIELRLDQEYGYVINVTQGDIEIIDYELGDSPTNQIRINQQ